MAGDMDELDPQVSTQGYFHIVNTAIWENLTLIDPNTLQIVPQLAESIQTPDPQTVVFKLRPGITFHSGDAFSSADVKYSLERVLNPKTASPLASTISSIASVDAVDNLTVRLNLSQPDPALLDSLATIRILS